MAHLTDIEIAQSVEMKPIGEIAAKVGITPDELEYYGKYKAKLGLERANGGGKDGKLILVTAMTPTGGRGKNDDDDRACRRTPQNRKKLRCGSP